MTESDEAPKSLRDLALTITAGVTKAMGDINRLNVADVGLAAATVQGAAATVQGAAVLALVHVGDQIRAQVEVQRELVEQQKLTNVLAAIGRSDLLAWDLEQAAVEYVRARIGDIVPGTSGVAVRR